MTLLAWLFLAVAIAIQALNFFLVLRQFSQGRRVSQVLIVPIVFWYIGALLNRGGFVFADTLFELALVVGVHALGLLLSVVVGKLSNKK